MRPEEARSDRWGCAVCGLDGANVADGSADAGVVVESRVACCDAVGGPLEA